MMSAAIGCATSAAMRDQRLLRARAAASEDELPDAPCGSLEFIAGLHVEIAGTWQCNIDDFSNTPGTRGHHDYPVRKQHRFGNRMGDEQDRLRPFLPDAHQLDGKLLARQCVERAER